MEKVNSENIFPGAQISLNESKFYVYKVNEKTAYIGTLGFAEVDRLVRNSKFLSIMKNIKAKKINFTEGYVISKEEIEKKESKKDFNPAGSSKKLRPISKLAEADLARNFNLKRKNMIQYGKEEVRPLVFNGNGQVLFTIGDGAFFFYDFQIGEYTIFNREKHKKGYGNINIVWPRKSEDGVEDVS